MEVVDEDEEEPAMFRLKLVITSQDEMTITAHHRYDYDEEEDWTELCHNCVAKFTATHVESDKWNLDMQLDQGFPFFTIIRVLNGQLQIIMPMAMEDEEPPFGGQEGPFADATRRPTTFEDEMGSQLCMTLAQTELLLHLSPAAAAC